MRTCICMWNIGPLSINICSLARFRCTYQQAMAHMSMSHVSRRTDVATTHTLFSTFSMSLVSMNHAKHINASHLTHQLVMPDIFMGHVSHINESCLTYQWLMSHKSMSHVSYINESYLTYQCAMSHISMHHVLHINGSNRTYQRAMSRRTNPSDFQRRPAFPNICSIGWQKEHILQIPSSTHNSMIGLFIAQTAEEHVLHIRSYYVKDKMRFFWRKELHTNRAHFRRVTCLDIQNASACNARYL